MQQTARPQLLLIISYVSVTCFCHHLVFWQFLFHIRKRARKAAQRFIRFFLSIHRLVILQTMFGQKQNFSTFSYKLVQTSPIMILVNSSAFLSISSWFCELTELIFVMIPYISSTGYPPTTQGIMGHVPVANRAFWPREE